MNIFKVSGAFEVFFYYSNLQKHQPKKKINNILEKKIKQISVKIILLTVMI